MSRYDADDVYCLPGSSVLKNKAGITDQELLDQYEADLTTIRLLELARSAVQGQFDLEHLCQIHRYLFRTSTSRLAVSELSTSFEVKVAFATSGISKPTRIPFFHL